MPFSSSTDEFSFVLKPSAIAGVGVFATHDIARGAALRIFPLPESRRIPFSDPIVTPERRKMYFEFYCVRDAQRKEYICPPDFGCLEIGWFINHSVDPNAEHRNFEYFAKRDISVGEEITVDYGTLEEGFGEGELITRD